jgi:hypothetical protein
VSDDDLNRIEHTLSIQLPYVYRRSVAPFPIPYEADNTSSQVWDNADQLIAINRRVRFEVEGWPSWLFVIGQAEGDPCGYAIDTRIPAAPVWWLEQMQLGSSSGPSGGSFETWFDRWVADAEPIGTLDSSIPWMLALWLALSLAAIVVYWVWVWIAHA